MKKLIVLLVLLFAVNTQACITGWLLGEPTEVDNPEAQFRAMLGLRMEDEAQVGNLDIGTPEIGVQYDWVGSDGDFDRWGVYGLLHLGDPAAADTWLGRPFVGLNVNLDVQGNDDTGNALGAVAGTIYGKIFAIMYQYTKYDGKLDPVFAEWQDEHKVYAGLVLKY